MVIMVGDGPPAPRGRLRRMFRHVSWGCVVSLGLVACGDNGPGVDAVDGSPATADAAPGGLYDDPSDFDRAGCTAGSLAGFDVGPAIYHLSVDFSGFTTVYAVRIDAPGGPGVADGRINGELPVQQAEASADDLFIRSDDPNSGLRVFDLCTQDADGTLHGTIARCPSGNCFTAPVIGHRVDRFDDAEGQGLSLVGEYVGGVAPWGGLAVNVRVQDQIAYLATYEDGLRIVDVTDPAAPVELGHVLPEQGGSDIWNDVKLIDGPGGGRYALMASSATALVVVDVTDPGAPAIVAHAGTAFTNVHSVVVQGTRVYLANIDTGFEIWDVADPTAPVELGGFVRSGSFLHDMFVRGDRAYLNWWDGGMAIVDISDPANVVELGAFSDYGETSSHAAAVTTIGARDIAVHGDEQYGAHVHVVDVTEGLPSFATGIAEWQTRPWVSVHNFVVVGDRAYMTHYQDGIRVIDLATPEAPVQVAYFNTWPGYAPGYGENFFEGAVGLDVDPAAGLVYVADTHRGLVILSID